MEKYASELSEGVRITGGGSPLVFYLMEVDETELADQLKRMFTEEVNHESRAERYLAILRPAKKVLSKDIQHRLRATVAESGDTG